MLYLLLTWLAAPWLLLRAWLHRPARPRRVVVVQTAKIGDFVATTPVFRELRRRLPEAEITAVLHPVNLPLARHLDCIDHIVALPAGGYRGWAGKRWLWRTLAEHGDSVLVLSPNLATYLAPLWAGICPRISVLPDRRAGSSRLAYPLLTHGEPHVPGRLFRDTALRALDGLAPAPAMSSPLRPEAVRTAAGEERADALLAGLAAPLVGIGVGAGNRLKALSIDQLAALMNCLLERTAATLVLVGTDQDRPAADALVAAYGPARVRSTAGECSLDELPALLARLDCFVGVDSGATYLADAVGVPVVDYMGPADVQDQRPVGMSVVIIKSMEPCAPCSHSFDAPYRCRLGSRACIVNTPLDAIAEAVATLLSGGTHDSCGGSTTDCAHQ